MKVCHIGNWLPYYHKKWGGAEQAHYRTMKLLGKKGVENFTITETPIKVPDEDFEFHTVKTVEDFSGSWLGKYIRWIKFALLAFDPFVYFGTYKLLKKMQPDIVHVHSFKALSFSVFFAAKKLGIPTVLSIYDYWYFCPKSTLFRKNKVCKDYHGSHCTDCLFSSKFGFLLKLPFFLRRPVFDYFVNKIDNFIVLSESSSKILQNYGVSKKKIHKIPLIFSLDEIPYKKREFKVTKKKSILYVGWLVIHKGLHVAIKAMPKILKEFPETELAVIGDLKADPEYVERIRSLIKELGLEKNVKIMGKVSDKVLGNYMNKADVNIVLEQWENMSPVILIDSMFLEKNIVASRIGGLPEFIENGKTGLLFKNDDPDELAKKVVYFLKNKSKGKVMGKNARKKVVKMFDNETLFKKLIDCYSSIIDSKKN